MTVRTLPRRDPDGHVICPPGHVSSGDLVHRAGISYRQLDYWTRTGLLTPAADSGLGSGSPRVYPIDQVHKAATLQWLLTAGMELQTCRRVIDDLMTTGTARLNNSLTIHLPQDL